MSRIQEHDVDRWEKLGCSYNILREETDGFWVNFNRKGNLSWKRAVYWENPQTRLNTCDLCGKLSTPKKVQVRNDCFCWDLWHGTPMLCTGCWNRVKPVLKYYDELNEIRKISKKLRAARREK